MAEPKPIISSVEEAVCDNCIWCEKSICYNSEGYWNVDTNTKEDFCNKGLWLFEVPGDEYLSNTNPQTLPSMHSLLRIKARKKRQGPTP